MSSVRWAVLSAALVVVPVGIGDVSPAGATGTFRGFARADAIDISFTDTGAPVFPEGPIVEASPATAEATIDSSGLSQGYASAPSPGRQITALPGVANGVTPNAPFPAYPFSAGSDYPRQPSAQQVQGPFAVSAVSGPARSESTAHAGGASGDPAFGSARSMATAERDDLGTVTATATAELNGLVTGALVKIGRIESRASIVSAANQPAVIDTAFNVIGLTVGGVVVGITKDGLTTAPGTPPGLDLNAVNGALAQAGMSIAYLPAKESATAVESAGLALSFTTEIPGQGTVLSTFTLGRVRAVAEQAGSDTADQDTSLLSPVPAQPATDAGPESSEPGTDADPAVIPALPARLPDAGSTSPTAGPIATPTPDDPTAMAASRRPAGAALSTGRPVAHRIVGPYARGTYLSLLAGAAVLLILTAASVRIFSGARIAASDPSTGPVLRLR